MQSAEINTLKQGIVAPFVYVSFNQCLLKN